MSLCHQPSSAVPAPRFAAAPPSPTSKTRPTQRSTRWTADWQLDWTAAAPAGIATDPATVDSKHEQIAGDCSAGETKDGSTASRRTLHASSTYQTAPNHRIPPDVTHHRHNAPPRLRTPSGPDAVTSDPVVRRRGKSHPPRAPQPADGVGGQHVIVVAGI
ncbi:hypothetical protein MAPG_04837 [Magnaporthiopsis poae ATCC 64411]|uniref:Uncharacterized protein n=1 Tax=Magnaporthiopsis poae (strain ATCC 64411 / 73-15) TaxID=644358 RepID=A0A0C4DXT0_MAGP6|nr:hypothetical protein MAPG_04837 [Magnaporthiopsis poae ATCC 64411]